MPTYTDSEDNLVTVPSGIEGIKTMPDGSVRFKMVGGPYHDMVFRVYAPFDHIRFPKNDSYPACVYRINPPLRKNGKWVYVHDNEATDE